MKKLLLLLALCGALLCSCTQTYPIDAQQVNENYQNRIAKNEIDMLPAEFHDSGIFKDSYIKAYEMLGEMTLEQKVGQMLLARCPQQNAEQDIKSYNLGGYVMFKCDFDGKTEDEVINQIKGFQSAAKIPMIIAVDEEGGRVVRISSNPNLRSEKFASPQKVYEKGGLSAVESDTAEKCALLNKLGVNTNLAPVCDVSENPDDYIYNRTLGKSAPETAEYIKMAVETAAKTPISSTLKHFPGYGSNVDTHTGIAVDERTKQAFENADFLPFKAGIEAGAECVLVSHNIINCIDSEKPASLSSGVHGVLRDELNFSGIIMTDDLSMDAIKLYTNGENPAVEAVKAGNDMLIVTDYAESYESIINAVENGELSHEQIDNAVIRILAWKLYKDII